MFFSLKRAVFFLFVAGQALASGKVPQGINSTELQKVALKTLVYQRCTHSFSIFDQDLADRLLTHEECRKVSASLIKSLSLSFVELGDHEVARVTRLSDLLNLLSKQEITDYLQQIQNSLGSIQSQKFDLYQLTFQFTGSKQKSIHWLGLLFQDISESQIHLRAIHTLHQKNKLSLSRKQIQNFDLLQQSCSLLYSLIESYKMGQDFFLYPQNLFSDQRSMSPVFYHYYTIAAVVSDMKKNPLSLEKIFFAGFIFNYLYEAYQMQGASIILNEPEVLPRSSIQDIYLGYRGALFGSDLEVQVRSLPPEKFFEDPPRIWIKKVVNTLF